MSIGSKDNNVTSGCAANSLRRFPFHTNLWSAWKNSKQHDLIKNSQVQFICKAQYQTVSQVAKGRKVKLNGKKKNSFKNLLIRIRKKWKKKHRERKFKEISFAQTARFYIFFMMNDFSSLDKMLYYLKTKENLPVWTRPMLKFQLLIWGTNLLSHYAHLKYYNIL